MFLISQHALPGRTTKIRKERRTNKQKNPPHIPTSTEKLKSTYSLTDILLKIFHYYLLSVIVLENLPSTEETQNLH